MRGFSIRKLSIMANVPYSTLYSIINRDSAGADSETINRIAKALNVTVADILLDIDEMADILSKNITNESIQEIAEKLKSGTERMNAFLTSIRAVGYDLVVEKNENGEDGYIFARKDKTWEHRMSEQDLIAMLHESLGYTEYLCIRMEKKLEDSDAPFTPDATPSEGKDPAQE